MSRFLSPGDIISLVVACVILAAVSHFSKGDEQYQMTPAELDAAFEESWNAQGGQYLDKIASTNDLDALDVDPFIDSPMFPGPSVTLGPPKMDGCVDTYKRTDISCDDKAAIIKYRNEMQDIMIEQLKEKNDRMEKQLQRDEFHQYEV